MGIFKSDTGVKSIFGDKAFEKLKGLLSDCCPENGACCASEKYTISVGEGDCSGAFVTYALTIVPNFNIPGALTVESVYIQDNTAVTTTNIWYATDGMTTSDSKVKDTILPKNKATQLFVMDTRGNYSNVLSFTTPNC